MANYGEGDATLVAAGGEDGVRRLVDHFYTLMEREYGEIWRMHDATDLARDKLARFLIGWMGGPRRYHERYGRISIPEVHRHLTVSAPHRDAWLACMGRACEAMAYPAELKNYLIEQLSYPAQRVHVFTTQQGDQ